MAKTPTSGATCLFNEDFIIKGGTDFFTTFRYDQHAANGGRDPVDMSQWEMYMAFARQGKKVLECNDCVWGTEDGWISVHLDPEVTKQLDAVKPNDTHFDYEIIARTDQGYIMSIAEGDALVTDMICYIPDEPAPNNALYWAQQDMYGEEE